MIASSTAFLSLATETIGYLIVNERAAYDALDSESQPGDNVDTKLIHIGRQMLIVQFWHDTKKQADEAEARAQEQTEPTPAEPAPTISSTESGDGWTYIQEYVKCGKPTCKTCANGPGHGPYWYGYQHDQATGKTKKKYLGKKQPPMSERAELDKARERFYQETGMNDAPAGSLMRQLDDVLRQE